MIALLLLALQGGVDPALLALYEQAGSAPAAVSSRALLRLAADPRWPADLRASTIQMAFERASGIAEAMPVTQASMGRRSGPAYWRQESSLLGLDRLTLQSRAVTAMAKAEPALARKLWDAIPAPAVPALSCLDESVPDVTVYYEAAVAVADYGFSPAERAKGAPLNFLVAMAGRMRSPVEVAPLINATRAAVLSPGDKETLATRTLAALEALQGDDRSFTASAIAAATAIDNWRHPRALEVFRGYLTRHLKQARCADTVEAGAVLNQFLGKYGIDATVKPDRVMDAPAPAATPEYRPSRELNRRRMELVSSADRGTPGWKSRLDEVLSAIEDAPPSRDDPPQSLREKIMLMANTMALVDAPGDRQGVVKRMAAVLTADALQSQQPMVWLSTVVYARRLCQSVSPETGAAFMDLLEKSTNPTLAFWARAERLLPGSPQ
jgi:hypothetical protein